MSVLREKIGLAVHQLASGYDLGTADRTGGHTGPACRFQDHERELRGLIRCVEASI